jgi:hypothetical protein
LPLLPPLEALLCRTEARENAKALLMALICRVLRTAVLASLLVVKAGAEKPPQLLPTRDVDIIYEVTLPSQSRIRERLRYLAAELLERVDSPYKSTTIFDRRTHEITILWSANRTFLKLDMPRQPQEPGPEATLKRGNESVVAGFQCVDWSWTEDVETRTVCITADGVLLRFLVDVQIVSEARSVGYRPQPAEVFQVPPGYAPCWPRKAAPCLDRRGAWRTLRYIFAETVEQQHTTVLKMPYGLGPAPDHPQGWSYKAPPPKTAGLSHYVEIGVDEKTDVVRNILNEVADSIRVTPTARSLNHFGLSVALQEAPDQLP